MRYATAFLLSLLLLGARAQKQKALVKGVVMDENDRPLAGVSVTELGKNAGTITSDSGTFSLSIPAEKSLALVFSHAGYRNEQRNFYLSPQEEEWINVRLLRAGKTISPVVISDNRYRREIGQVRINPKNALVLPGPVSGVEGMIKTLVGSNNELTSQYSVRGGNFDENLVYINDIEIFRPYLVSSAQQEGLSMINPELAKSVSFQSGGFQARYGDKISSVLDIQYKRPDQFRGSAYISLLEQGLHVEGSSRSGKFTYIAGARNRSNRNILSNQPTQGSYIPSSSDIQAFLTGKISDKTSLECLQIFSTSAFTFYPEFVQKTASVFSPLFSSNLGLDIYFEGKEKDRYNTLLSALTVKNTLSKSLSLKWIVSYLGNREQENYDIGGAYLFGDRDYDKNSGTFGQIVNPLAAGYYQQYGRNKLDIDVWSLSHRGYADRGRHQWQWGLQAEKTMINDRLFQWEYQDSAGYSLPYSAGSLPLFQSLNSTANLDIVKLSGYCQDNYHWKNRQGDFSMQAGIRFHFNDLNQQTLWSPRLQWSWIPAKNRDLILKAAAGVYSQPPFYRELRANDGSIRKDIKAQQSLQFTAGADYVLQGKERPYRITSEFYYKSLRDVIPYDVDNVKTRYLGGNLAKAYAVGAECRIYGQLLKDAESWLSLGWMKTMENLEDDHYYQYRNAAGEVIGPNTTDKNIADSNRVDIGWLRRPSDRRFTIGLFLQDYLATNENFKVHLNMIYGSNMPYNIPNSVRYRNGLTIDSYIRVDMGFSVLLLDERSRRRSHSPFRDFENIWFSLEVFNLINRANTISYQLVKDFSNNSFAIPNRLTPRLLNFKMVARF